MEYFTGAITTLIIVFVLNLVVRKNIKQRPTVVKYSQSHVFELIKPFVSEIIFSTPLLKTQAIKHSNNQTLRILFLDGMAYWIESNKLLEANLFDNGNIDHSTMREVDTMGMDDVQLKKTMFIVERLREGFDNDSGYTGNQNF